MKRNLLFLLISTGIFIGYSVLVSPDSILQYWYSLTPLHLVILVSLILILVSFSFGLITDDYSWVDRLWSTAPILYAWIYASKYGFNPAVLTGAVLVTLWGMRLTFNFARKGGYSGMEDYRWPILKKKINNNILWQSFNLLFICGFQIGLFILFTSPFLQLKAGIAHPILFIIAICLLIGFIVYETIADQQQWIFHQAKKSGLEKGFLVKGLFKYSRHPNYFGELGVWWSFYIMGIAASGIFLHWTFLGPVILTLLFIGSTIYTESITASKYPDYSVYQNSTSVIIPWIKTSKIEMKDTVKDSD